MEKLFGFGLYCWFFFWGLSLVTETTYSDVWDGLAMACGCLIMLFSVWATVELIRSLGKKKQASSSADNTVYYADIPDDPVTPAPRFSKKADLDNIGDNGSISDSD